MKVSEAVPRFIVAEVSKNWRDGVEIVDTPILATQFETVINVNLRRGYRLHSWKLDRMTDSTGALNETIVAVFERMSTRGAS